MSFLKIIKFIAAHPLTRDREFRDLLHFVRRQLGSRLAPGAIVCQWINEAKFLARIE